MRQPARKRSRLTSATSSSSASRASLFCAHGKLSGIKMRTQNDEQLSNNFKLSELQCPCPACDGGRPTADLVRKLQGLRDLSGLPLLVTSGVRCAAHNATVGGKSGSQHVLGNAADLHYQNGDELFKLIANALRVGFTGLGIAKSYVHVDVRQTERVAWTYYP